MVICLNGECLKHAVIVLANVGLEDAAWRFFQSRRVAVVLSQNFGAP